MKPKLLEPEDTLAGKPEAALDDTVEFSFLEDTQDLELLLDIEDAKRPVSIESDGSRQAIRVIDPDISSGLLRKPISALRPWQIVFQALQPLCASVLKD